MSKIPIVPSCIPIMAEEFFSRVAVDMCRENGDSIHELHPNSRLAIQQLAAKQAVDLYLLCQGEWNKNFPTAEGMWSVEK